MGADLTGCQGLFLQQPDNSTPLSTVWKTRPGVCQDFAHIGLSVLRTAGLPARYVCGYIEADSPGAGRRLKGAVATHAWIEVLVPGMTWVALDPTNRQWVDERYVSVSYGLDYRDAAPLRGTFKGSGGQKMSVQVHMKRRRERWPGGPCDCPGIPPSRSIPWAFSRVTTVRPCRDA